MFELRWMIFFAGERERGLVEVDSAWDHTFWLRRTLTWRGLYLAGDHSLDEQIWGVLGGYNSYDRTYLRGSVPGRWSQSWWTDLGYFGGLQFLRSYLPEGVCTWQVMAIVKSLMIGIWGARDWNHGDWVVRDQNIGTSHKFLPFIQCTHPAIEQFVPSPSCCWR